MGLPSPFASNVNRVLWLTGSGGFMRVRCWLRRRFRHLVLISHDRLVLISLGHILIHPHHNHHYNHHNHPHYNHHHNHHHHYNHHHYNHLNHSSTLITLLDLSDSSLPLVPFLHSPNPLSSPSPLSRLPPHRSDSPFPLRRHCRICSR